MSQAQLTFIGKITTWLKSLFKKKDEILETIEEVIEVVEDTAQVVEQVVTRAKSRPSRKVRDVSKTIDATIAKVRGASVVLDEAANISEKVIEVVEAVESFKKGRFDEIEITTIQNAITVAGKLDVDWNTLSTNLNRDIKSIKAKAKLLSK